MSELNSSDRLQGVELLKSLDEQQEDEDICGLQERVYNCNYQLNGEPDYYGFARAVLEANDLEPEDVEIELYSIDEIGHIAIEAGTALKRDGCLYMSLIHAACELFGDDMSCTTLHQLAKSLSLKISFGKSFETGPIADYIDNKLGHYDDEDSSTPDRDQLLALIKPEDSCSKLTYELVEESGFILFDEDGNPNPDYAGFLETVIGSNTSGADSGFLNNIDTDKLSEIINEKLRSNLPYELDTAMWDNTPVLEAAAIIEGFSASVSFEDNPISPTSLLTAKLQSVRPSPDSGDIRGGVLPPGKYWIGDLSYTMNNYFERCIYRTNGVFKDQDQTLYARFGTKMGDGYYQDDISYGYGVDTGSIGCIQASAIRSDGSHSLGKFVDFNEPFECNWFESGGFIQFGHIWIKTDLLNDSRALHSCQFLPRNLGAIGFGSIFFDSETLNNSLCARYFQDIDFWDRLRSAVENNSLLDKTKKIIYSLKIDVMQLKITPELAFDSLILNYGTDRVSQAFYEIYDDLAPLLLTSEEAKAATEIKRDKRGFYRKNHSKIDAFLHSNCPSFCTAVGMYYNVSDEVLEALSMDLWSYFNNPAEIKLRTYSQLIEGNPATFQEDKIISVESLSLESHPEELRYKREKEISEFLEKIASKLRKRLWPEGDEASQWWASLANQKREVKDAAYESIALDLAKFHAKKISGDEVYSNSSQFSNEERFRIFMDIQENSKWFEG